MALCTIMILCAALPASAVRRQPPARAMTMPEPAVIESVEGMPVAVEPVRAEPRFGRVDISAEPWGLVTVPGVIGGRETPVRGVRIAAGDHRLTVSHAPSGARVTRTVHIVPDETLRCFARFLPRPTMSCR